MTRAVATALAANAEVTIALRASLNDTKLRRWESLADSSGASTVRLGDAGWNRVVFGDRSLVLEHADLPAELFGGDSVIALSSPAGDGVLGLWTDVVHPNSALRARVAGNATTELASAVAAQYIIAGQVGSYWIVAVAAPAIVAELLAKGIERLRERLRGYETPGPWEDRGVQHLAWVGHAGQSALNLALRVSVSDTAGERIAWQLSEMLGWILEIDAVGDDDGER